MFPSAFRGDRRCVLVALPRQWRVVLRAGWSTLLLGIWIGGDIVAKDFRIETRVYVADEEQPVSQSVTLFEAGVVYDFLEQPAQVAVFRKPAAERPGRFILLDPQREMRTELTTDQLERVLEKVRAWASTQEDGLLRFTAQPIFQQTFDEPAGELSLRSELLSYRIETSEEGDVVSVQNYLQFCDWYARLNAVVASQMLPFARLAANQALAKHGRVPRRVHLSIPGDGIEMRAEHQFKWLLSKQDKSRIDEVRRQLQNFRTVSNAEYRKIEQN